MVHNCSLRSIWKMQIYNDKHIFQKGKAGFRSYSSLNQRMRSSAAHQEWNPRDEIPLSDVVGPVLSGGEKWVCSQTRRCELQVIAFLIQRNCTPGWPLGAEAFCQAKTILKPC